MLATGTFPADGPVHGTVQIVQGDGGTWRVQYPDLALGDGVASSDLWLVVDAPASASGCPNPNDWRADLSAAARGASAVGASELTVPRTFLDEPAFYDPTFIQSVGIRLRGASCGSLNLAEAPLTWAIAPLHPEVTGTDSGPRDGARGSTADGVYTIADGDTAAGIEARFGLSADELDYLNPISQRPAPNPYVQFPKAGCTVNTAFDARGHFIQCD